MIRRVLLTAIVAVGALVRKNDVENLLAGTQGRNFLDQFCLGGMRPGPGADFFEAFLVDVNNDKAALVPAVSAEVPDQVARTFLEPGQHVARSIVQKQPRQTGQKQAERKNAVPA